MKKFVVSIYKDGNQTGTKWCEAKQTEENPGFRDRSGVMQCCCNCQSRVQIMGHPWVTGDSADTRHAWGCVVMLFGPPGDRNDEVMLSHEHGMCEMWMLRKPCA